MTIGRLVKQESDPVLTYSAYAPYRKRHGVLLNLICVDTFRKTGRTALRTRGRDTKFTYGFDILQGFCKSGSSADLRRPDIHAVLEQARSDNTVSHGLQSRIHGRSPGHGPDLPASPSLYLVAAPSTDRA